MKKIKLINYILFKNLPKIFLLILNIFAICGLFNIDNTSRVDIESYQILPNKSLLVTTNSSTKIYKTEKYKLSEDKKSIIVNNYTYFILILLFNILLFALLCLSIEQKDNIFHIKYSLAQLESRNIYAYCTPTNIVYIYDNHVLCIDDSILNTSQLTLSLHQYLKKLDNFEVFDPITFK